MKGSIEMYTNETKIFTHYLLVEDKLMSDYTIARNQELERWR